MNRKLALFARATLVDDLRQCSEDQRTVFKLMYGRAADKRGLPTRNVEETKAMDIDAVVAEMPEDKLDWAMEQVGLPAKQLNVPDHTAQTNTPARPADLELPVEVSSDHVNGPL